MTTPATALIAEAEAALAADRDRNAPPASRPLRRRRLYRHGAALAARIAAGERWLGEHWDDAEEERWVGQLRGYEAARRCLREIDEWLDAQTEAA